MQSDPGAPEPVTAPAGHRSASWAALLSFLWPGLGQAFRGRRRAALLHGLPPALIVLGVVAVAAMGLEQLALRLLTPQVALGATALVVGLAIWRIFSIFDARRRGGVVTAADGHPRRSLVLAGLLALLVVATHGYAAYYAFSFYRAGEQIFEPATGVQPSPTPEQTTDPAIPTPTLEPGATPPPSEAPPSDMINVLFVGIDRGTLDNTNTDTMLVASFDPRTDQVVMISLPRDVSQVPLYTGDIWRRKINTFYHHAASNPDKFPEGGMGALVRQMEFLIGVPIHYYASIEIDGFRRIIDLVGGVDVVLERAINDPTYQHTPDETGFFMQPGRHHLDGATALAYVRSRHGPGGSDFARARRQQQVLLALRERLHDPGVFLNLPSLLDLGAQIVRTDVPPDRLPELVELVQASEEAEARNIVLGPPRFAERIPRSETGGLYALRLNIEALADLSLSLFGHESRYAREGLPPVPTDGLPIR